MEIRDKEVLFSTYCNTCKYKDLAEKEDPCDECLMYPSNENSHKPVCWVSKEE